MARDRDRRAPRQEDSTAPRRRQWEVVFEDAPQHGYFGPGTPQTMKSGRFFEIVWPPPTPIRQKVENSKKCSVTQ